MVTRFNLVILIMAFNTQFLILTGQSSSFYKSGSLQIPNSEKLHGLIWMPGTAIDSVSYIYFRKNSEDYPIRYDANEIISFEFDKRQFVSLVVPFGGGNYQRINELHFDGSDYRLLSTVDNKDMIYYLVDNSGKITMLVNTYSLPVIGPTGVKKDFSVNYNYEYRSELALVFSEHPELLIEIETIEFRTNDLVKLLIKYHEKVNAPYFIYSTPNGINGIVGISGGYTQIKSVNSIDVSEAASTPFLSFRLFGELASKYKPFFFNAGVSVAHGQIWHDLKKTFSNRISYYDVTTTVSMIKFDFRVGTRFLKAGKFTPFISAGGEYNSYLHYSSECVQEDVYSNATTLVYTTLLEVDNKPEGFPGVALEIGTNYKYNKESDFRFGVSYHHFFDKEDIMKNGIGISFTYYRAIF